MAKSQAERVAEMKRLIEQHPGIRAQDLAKQIGVDKGLVSKYLEGLKRSDEIVQKPIGKGMPRGNGRSMGLHPTTSALKRKMMREKWR